MDPETITGRPHELIDRLMHVIDRDPGGDDRWWQTLAIWAAVALGCTGAIGRCKSQRIAMDAVADRLRSLVEAGLDEVFVVGAVRDLLDKRIRELADLEAAGRGIDRLRKALRLAESDPAAFRAGNPDLAGVSDEKLVETARDMLANATLSPEEVARRQRDYAYWQELSGESLPEDALNAWSLRSAVPGRYLS